MSPYHFLFKLHCYYFKYMVHNLRSKGRHYLFGLSFRPFWNDSLFLVPFFFRLSFGSFHFISSLSSWSACLATKLSSYWSTFPKLSASSIQAFFPSDGLPLGVLLLPQHVPIRVLPVGGLCGLRGRLPRVHAPAQGGDWGKGLPGKVPRVRREEHHHRYFGLG